MDGMEGMLQGWKNMVLLYQKIKGKMYSFFIGKPFLSWKVYRFLKFVLPNRKFCCIFQECENNKAYCYVRKMRKRI